MHDLKFGFPAGDLLNCAHDVAEERLAERAALVKAVAPKRLADDAVVEDKVNERLTVLFDDERLLILRFPDLKGVLTGQQVGEFVERPFHVLAFLEVLGNLVAELLSGPVGDCVRSPACNLFKRPDDKAVEFHHAVKRLLHLFWFRRAVEGDILGPIDEIGVKRLMQFVDITSGHQITFRSISQTLMST